MVYLDETFPDHPKILRAAEICGPGSYGDVIALFVCGLCYARHYATDGYIPVSALSARVSNAIAVAESLVAAGLWKSCGKAVDGYAVTESNGGETGYLIHDYKDWQKTAAEVKAARASARRRMRKYRERQELRRGAVTS